MDERTTGPEIEHDGKFTGHRQCPRRGSGKKKSCEGLKPFGEISGPKTRENF